MRAEEEEQEEVSREFGSYCQGYFHTQIEYAASDCLNGRDDLTKLWGAFLQEFSVTAWGIASSEACDSGPDFPIMECIKAMPHLKHRLQVIEDYLKPFQRVAESAVAEKLKAGGKQ